MWAEIIGDWAKPSGDRFGSAKHGRHPGGRSRGEEVVMGVTNSFLASLIQIWEVEQHLDN